MDALLEGSLEWAAGRGRGEVAKTSSQCLGCVNFFASWKEIFKGSTVRTPELAGKASDCLEFGCIWHVVNKLNNKAN